MKFFYVWALMRASFVLIVIPIYACKALFRKRQKCAKWHQRFLCMYAILAAGASQASFFVIPEISPSDISCIIKNGSNRSHFLFKRGFVISLSRRTVLPRYPIP